MKSDGNRFIAAIIDASAHCHFRMNSIGVCIPTKAFTPWNFVLFWCLKKLQPRERLLEVAQLAMFSIINRVFIHSLTFDKIYLAERHEDIFHLDLNLRISGKNATRTRGGVHLFDLDRFSNDLIIKFHSTTEDRRSALGLISVVSSSTLISKLDQARFNCALEVHRDRKMESCGIFCV